MTYHNLTSSEYVLYILYNVSKYTDMSTNGFHLDLQVIVIFTVDCTFSNEYMKKKYFFGGQDKAAQRQTFSGASVSAFHCI